MNSRYSSAEAKNLKNSNSPCTGKVEIDNFPTGKVEIDNYPHKSGIGNSLYRRGETCNSPHRKH